MGMKEIKGTVAKVIIGVFEGGKVIKEMFTRDVFVGGDIDPATGEWSPNAGAGRSNLKVSGDADFHGRTWFAEDVYVGGETANDESATKVITEADTPAIIAEATKKIPTKLSDLENDLFYVKKVPFLTLTKEDFTLNEGDLVYVGNPALGWLTSEESISFTITYKTTSGYNYQISSDNNEVEHYTNENVDGDHSIYFDWYQYADLNNPDTEHNCYGYINDIYNRLEDDVCDGFSVWLYNGEDYEEITMEIYRVESKKLPIDYCDLSEFETEILAQIDTAIGEVRKIQ